MSLPDFIYAGPKNITSSWMCEAFSQNPGMATAKEDSTNFFDAKYYKGME